MTPNEAEGETTKLTPAAARSLPDGTSECRVADEPLHETAASCGGSSLLLREKSEGEPETTACFGQMPTCMSGCWRLLRFVEVHAGTLNRVCIATAWFGQICIGRSLPYRSNPVDFLAWGPTGTPHCV